MAGSASPDKRSGWTPRTGPSFTGPTPGVAWKHRSGGSIAIICGEKWAREGQAGRALRPLISARPNGKEAAPLFATIALDFRVPDRDWRIACVDDLVDVPKPEEVEKHVRALPHSPKMPPRPGPSRASWLRATDSPSGSGGKCSRSTPGVASPVPPGRPPDQDGRAPKAAAHRSNAAHDEGLVEARSLRWVSINALDPVGSIKRTRLASCAQEVRRATAGP